MPVARKRGRPRKKEETPSRGGFSDAQIAATQEIKTFIQETLLGVPSTKVSEADVAEFVTSQSKKPTQTVREQVKLLASVLCRSEKTVESWRMEGLNLFDPLEIVRFVTWKNSRAKNTRHLTGLPRRIRSPFD